MIHRLRAPLAIAIVAIAVTLSAGVLASGDALMCSFKAFYCAAHVLASGGNPYAATPLYSCESAAAPAPLFVAKGGLVMPGPLPGYAMAALLPFAALTFPLAALLWFVVLSCCVIGSIMLLARLGIGHTWSIAVALSVALIGDALCSGELEPIALLGIALAAWSASQRRVSFGLSAILGTGVALSFAEPQVGIAVAIACAMLGRRAATAAAVAVTLLTLTSIVALGIEGNVAYVRSVVPAHLSAELPSFSQFSLSWALNRLGVAAGPALTAGRVQWLIMLALAGWFARSKIARKSPEVAVLGAPAFAVLGGPFAHPDQIALAIPAALWIASNYAPALRPAAVMPVVLALPLMMLLMDGAVSGILVVIVSGAVAGWLGAEYGRSTEFAVWCSVLAVIALTAMALLSNVTHASIVQVSAPSIPASMAQASWAHYIATRSVVTAWPIWLVKAPTWLGVLATVAALTLAARPKQSEHAIA